ncbi:MAG: FAD-dependent oxidoreductase [Candidatus Micrarchaeia archaeon]
MVKEYTAIVGKVVVWADGLKSIYLRFKDEKMAFSAGQYVMLRAKINDKLESRAYSIASTPIDDEIEIIFRVVGPFTTYLDRLKEGDIIEVVGPFGHLNKGMAKRRNAVFVATGTGLSPLLSIITDIIKSGECARFGSIVLLYGTKYENMLVHKKEIEELMAKCPNFVFCPILSREEKWVGRSGHVQAHIGEFIKDDTDYFICGLPAMTDEVEKILLEKGVKKECIHLERF